MVQQLSTNTFGLCKWIVSTDPTQGTHTTLTAAMASASAGDTIGIRAGTTLTENITGKAGIGITGLGPDGSVNNTGNVKIIGKLSMSVAGQMNIANLEWQTNGDYIVEVTGSAATNIVYMNCFLNMSNFTGFRNSSSSSSSGISFYNCTGDQATTGIAIFSNVGSGNIGFDHTFINNSGNSSTQSVCSSGGIGLSYSVLVTQISYSSGVTSGIFYSRVISNNVGAIIATAGAIICVDSVFEAGGASAINAGLGSWIQLHNCLINSSTTNVTGTGQVSVNIVRFGGGGALVNTTTQVGDLFACKGISFDGGTNNLNAYSVGTWTPTIVPSGTAFTSITYGTRTGRWTKIGNLVQVSAYCPVTALTVGSASGDITLPLPFNVTSAESTVVTGAMRMDNQAISGRYVIAATGASGSQLTPQMMNTSAAATNLPASGGTSNMGFAFSLMYRYA